MNTPATLFSFPHRALQHLMIPLWKKTMPGSSFFNILTGVVLSTPAFIVHAAPLDLPDSPISISTAVEPNVMILFDNSGSMRSMAWGKDYDTAGTYATWCGDCASDNRWPTDDNINLKQINRTDPGGTCSTSNPIADVTITDKYSTTGTTVVPRVVVQGEDASGTLKCLILPDPLDGGESPYSGHYLNYLFTTYADGTDLTQVSANEVSKKTRLQLARDVMSNLVGTTAGMNFGLSVFNGTEGAEIRQSCDKDSSLTASEILKINTDSYTPLAEALYEITRYFRGLRSKYSSTKYTSPITHRCQKNYAIVVTDGYATRDTNLNFRSGDDPDIKSGCNSADGDPGTDPCLPDWDEEHASATEAQFPNFDEFSDGFYMEGLAGQDNSDEGYTLYLDDIAKFAYDIDLLSDPPKSGSSASSTDVNGKSFDATPHEKQNLETYTIGFSVANQMLEDAGHYGSGKTQSDPRETDPALQHYFTASNESSLDNQLRQAISSIAGANSSSAAVAASSGFVGGSAGSAISYIFQGTYESKTWSGELAAYAIDPENGDISKDPVVKASTALSTQLATPGGVDNRNIITYNPISQSGIPFKWGSLDTSQQAYFNNRPEIVEYIRGSQACETNSLETCPTGQIKDLRDRNVDGEGLLGTFVGSSPVYIASPPFRYPDQWPDKADPENSADEFNTYSAFKKKYTSRMALIYVGSNDGMLHAFDGGRPENEYYPTKLPAIAPKLEERFTYIPNAVMPKLSDYSDVNYQHRYYVNATPTIIDVFFSSDSKWHTVLVGGLNKGGQAIYALDVTDAPSSFDETNVLWEFTDSYDDTSSPGVEGADLGYTYSQPAIVRMQNGKWAAVFGNGYNNTFADDNTSTTGHAYLYIVDIETGKLIRKIDTGEGTTTTPNGLATVAPIDLDNDYKIDFIYAGDLKGYLWRFDVKDSDSAKWTVLGRGANPTTQPLFKAVDAGGKRQPITSRPEVARAGRNGVMIFLGTGSYLQHADKSDVSAQTFYGLLDDPEGDHYNQLETTPIVKTAVTRTTMIVSTITPFSYSGYEVREVERGSVATAYTSWLVDLPDTGERVVGSPLVRGTKRPKVIFSSIVPTDDACDYGGSSWLMELDARNGGPTSKPVFDLNGDGDPSNDKIYNGVHYTGIQTSPTVVSAEGKEYKYMSNSATASNVTKIIESEAERQGRVSWRQLK